MIRLLDDVFPEPTESFQVFLSTSPGVYIQSPAVATVVIIDTDPNIPGIAIDIELLIKFQILFQL